VSSWKRLHHRFEHVEGFFLFDQRIVLTVSAQPNALFQVVHAEQVIFPLLVITLSMIIARDEHRIWAISSLIVALWLSKIRAQFLPVQLIAFTPSEENRAEAA